MTLATILPYWLLLLPLIAGIELLEDRKSQKLRPRKRWPANLALLIMTAGFASIVPISGFVAASWAHQNQIGLLNYFSTPTTIAVVITFTWLSFWGYIVHLAAHKIPLLWRFHKIHHSDLTLDVTTTFRTHPLIYLTVSGITALIAIGLGLNPSAVIAYATIVLLIELSHHTALKLPEQIDRRLRPYIITPALHHIHHSDHAVETDSNYGQDLALWDRLFGTYIVESKRPAGEFQYGLQQFSQERADDLDALLIAPFKGDANS